MGTHIPNVLEIDRKLRDDFRRRVKDFGVTSETTDPAAGGAVPHRRAADRPGLQRHRPAAAVLLHDLMSGLQVQQYLATPAQAAVGLINDLPEPRVLRAAPN